MKYIEYDDYDYTSLYSSYPNEKAELIHLLENTLNLNPSKVLDEEKKLKDIKWGEKEYTFFLVPKGTPRPRSAGGHFYVKGASQIKKKFKKVLDNEGIICTRCEFDLEVYLPTPINSMTKMEVLMSEKGLIRPIVTPDFDNLAKTYTDALQGILILNDNIISSGRVEKYYSIKPRIKMVLRYQMGFDCKYNERKTINSVGYKKIIGGM